VESFANPRERATEYSHIEFHYCSVACSRGLILFVVLFLGLTPQALRCRLLRRLVMRPVVLPLLIPSALLSIRFS